MDLHRDQVVIRREQDRGLGDEGGDLRRARVDDPERDGGLRGLAEQVRDPQRDEVRSERDERVEGGTVSERGFRRSARVERPRFVGDVVGGARGRVVVGRSGP